MKSPWLTLPAALFLLLAGAVAPLSAADWYVTGAGDDAKDGKSLENAWRTLQKAADLVEPGDTVHVGEGIYTNAETQSDSAVLKLHRSGKPDAWITWKAVPGTRPELRPVGWNGIFISGNYNVLDGLTVTGANDSIVLLQALDDAKIKEKNGKRYFGDPKFNTNGIFFTGRNNPPESKPHHLIVRNCVVSKFPGGGITGIEVDYFTVEDCLVFENAWFMRYGGSGITTLNLWAHDDAPGYHVVIQRNKVWANRTYVPWEVVNKLSDGNGILQDVTDQETAGATNPNADPNVAATNPNADPAVTPTPKPDETPKPPKPPRPEWKGRTLIANNVSAYNGGSGIHTFRTRGVDIINNTTYWNGRNTGYEELFPNRSEDIVILNNVIVPRPGTGKVTSNNRNKNIRWDFNLYPIEQKVIRGPSDVVAEPRFIKVAPDLREADFRLAPDSPARDNGTDEVPQAEDVLGQPRPAGKGRDRGAFEQ